MTYVVRLTNPDVLIYQGESWEHVRREIRDHTILQASGMVAVREITVETTPVTAEA